MISPAHHRPAPPTPGTPPPGEWLSPEQGSGGVPRRTAHRGRGRGLRSPIGLQAASSPGRNPPLPPAPSFPPHFLGVFRSRICLFFSLLIHLKYIRLAANWKEGDITSLTHRRPQAAPPVVAPPPRGDQGDCHSPALAELLGAPDMRTVDGARGPGGACAPEGRGQAPGGGFWGRVWVSGVPGMHGRTMGGCRGSS